jgi:rhodanese-related sulfurtransferase
VARKTIDELLEDARTRLSRVSPHEAREALGRGVLLIDMRGAEQRAADGVGPGAVWIPRNVLEWRLDPDAGRQHPAVGALDSELILFCQQGYASSLAAASLQELGFERATDMVGGFEAWRDAGLPVDPP